MTQQELLPALQFTPPVISLNFEELEARITGITETYTDLVVQEDDVPAIKDEMAGLNKLAKSLADARKDAVSRVSDPIKDFEEKVKKLEKQVLDTRTFLDDQVKAHIERERNSRRAAVQVSIDFLKDEHGCNDLNIPIQESWLNKTAKDKVVTAEIQAIILAHKKAQEEKVALESAKQDRVVAIEQHCEAMNAQREYKFTFSQFAHLQDLNIPLSEVMRAIADAYSREDERRKPVEPAPEPVKEEPHWIEMPEPPVQEESVREVKAMVITATYDRANADAIKVAYAHLRSLCLTCSVDFKEMKG